MAKRGKTGNGKSTLTTANGAAVEPMQDYRHAEAKRKNNPPARIAAEGHMPVLPKSEYAYNPHLPPVLRFDGSGEADRLPALLEKATREPLSREEAKLLAEALGKEEPWLEWTGKREAKSFEALSGRRACPSRPGSTGGWR